MKKSYLFALATLTLVGCANDSFNGLKGPEAGEPGAIAFGTGTNKASRDGDKTGSEAAGLLGGEFVVEGYKTMADNSTQLVFNDYTVQYQDGSALATESNTKGWEYVGINGQTIKYWDKDASNYTFAAYSLGAQETGHTAAATAIDNAAIGTNTAAYTLSGTVEELQKCYVSNVNITNNYADAVSPDAAAADYAVTLRFKKMQSQVRIGFYEVIPGYKVENIKFYDAAGDAIDGYTADLYAAAEQFSAATAKAQMVVTYPNITDNTAGTGYCEPVVTFSQTDGTDKVKDLAIAHRVGTDNVDDGVDHYVIGETNPTASCTEFVPVVPMAAGALTIKVDYTLVSDDGKTTETIEIKGATATIPATFTTWQPNYTYTYIFKISDKTTDLYPITFDAAVITEEEGNQHTITLIDNPSITTYQKGTTNQNEYVAGSAIYAVFDTEENIDATHVKLYTITNATTGAVSTESDCINAYQAAGLTYNGTTLVALTADTDYTIGAASIPMEDGTNKNATALTITDPEAGTNYAIIYDNGDATDRVVVCKVVKVAE